MIGLWRLLKGPQGPVVVRSGDESHLAGFGLLPSETAVASEPGRAPGPEPDPPPSSPADAAPGADAGDPTPQPDPTVAPAAGAPLPPDLKVHQYRRHPQGWIHVDDWP